jgi:endogenous inhibitor of DNA gyrase (YacG/DUF329 family)
MSELSCPECRYTPSGAEDDPEALPGSPWILEFDLVSGREVETTRCPECQTVVERVDPWAQEGSQ